MFRTSVDVSDTPPAFSKDYLEHKGKYYILSEGHKRNDIQNRNGYQRMIRR